MKFSAFVQRTLIYRMYVNINWRYVQTKNGVNNVDMSYLRAPWQNGPYKTEHKERHKNPYNIKRENQMLCHYCRFSHDSAHMHVVGLVFVTSVVIFLISGIVIKITHKATFLYLRMSYLFRVHSSKMAAVLQKHPIVPHCTMFPTYDKGHNRSIQHYSLKYVFGLKMDTHLQRKIK